MRAAQAIMADLAAAGLSEGQLALVMELSAAVATEARPVEDRAASRRRTRDREYQAERRRQNRPISADAPPLDKNSIPLGSEPNGSGASADPIKELFDVGVSILTASGQTEKQARSLIGKWRKAKSDGEVLTGLLDCRGKAISSPVEWLEKRFKPARYVSASGYEYRGSLEQIEREAKRRSDNDTYWQIQVDKKQDAAHV